MKRMLSTSLAMVILITLVACGTSEKTSVIPPEEYSALHDKYFLLYGNIFLGYSWNDAAELEPEIFLTYCAHYFYREEPFEAGVSSSMPIPQDIVEPMVQRHFNVSVDFLRSGSGYSPEFEIYSVHVFGDPTYIQITSAEQNGTLLTICYDMIHPVQNHVGEFFARVLAQGTVVIDVKDEDYKYLSNSITYASESIMATHRS